MNQEYLERLNGYIEYSKGVLEPAERFRLNQVYQAAQENPEIIKSLPGIRNRLESALEFCPKGSERYYILSEGISLLREITKIQEQT